MTESTQPYSVHLTGYPRIGANRELKWALERHWAGKIDRPEFNERITELRIGHLAEQRAHLRLGLMPLEQQRGDGPPTNTPVVAEQMADPYHLRSEICRPIESRAT